MMSFLMENMIMILASKYKRIKSQTVGTTIRVKSKVAK